MNQTFDLSKLQRRKPDMRSIATPRFLFPGWKLDWIAPNVLNELNESDFVRLDKNDVVIRLSRSDKYEINITWSDDPKNQGWVIAGPRIGTHWSKPIIVWVQRDVTFEELVKGTEAYIMRCISNQQTGELLPNPDKGWNNAREYTMYVETALSIWRKQESTY